MADYSVDIKIAVAGAKELKAARKETTALTREINTLNKLANKQSKTLPNSFNTLNKVLGQARGNLNKVALGTERYFRAISDVIDKEERLSRAYRKQKTDFKVIERLRRKGLQINKQNIQQIRNEIAAELRLARAKAATAKASVTKGMSARLSGTASSAIIGGAFPLLFGQTGAAAIGGGIGGAAGGAIGGQFGFALSILGTAIGSAIDKAEKFNKSLVELNQRMGVTGSSTAITAKEINSLAKSLNITKEEVFGVLGAFKEFGSGDIAKSMAMIFGTDGAGADRFAGLNRSAQLAQEIFNARKEIGNQAAKDLLIQNQSVDAAVVELALVKAKAKAEQDAAIARVKAVTAFDQFRANTPGLLIMRMLGQMEITDYGDIRAEQLQEQFDKDNLTLLENYKQGMIEARELLDLLRQSQGEFGLSGTLQFTAVTDKIKDLQDEIKKLTDPIYMVINLSDIMSNSFEESFKGIIKGTMTVADAFRNMLNRIADYFLDTVARLMANQFSRMLLGSFANAFISPQTRGIMDDFGMSRTDAATIAGGGFVETVFEPKASGGPVKRGGSYLVGERGPELFSPTSSGMITPNHALGGTTVVVNVDASGTSVEGNEANGEELGRLIGAVVQSELIKEKRPGGLLS